MSSRPSTAATAFFALVVFTLLAPSTRTASVSVEELVAKHVAARGGLDAIRAVRNMKLTGRLVFTGGGFEMAYSELVARPGRVRMEYSMQGLTGVQAWDGQEGWQISPFNGRKDPERTSRDDNKGLIDDADIDGPLVDTAAKGATLAYLGTEDVDGTDAHKIKVSQKDGDTLTVYLDPDYFLVIRVRYQHTQRGAEVQTETDFGNYERVGGVLIPFSYESGAPGGPRNQKIILDAAELNVALDDSVFAFPVTGAAPKQHAAAAVPVASAPAARAAAAAAAVPSLVTSGRVVFDSGIVSGLGVRNIGSAAMSGRIAALAARAGADGKTTIYVGSASGGVWRSRDSGTTFRPVFDREPVQSIGAVAIDPSNPQTVWVGTGEAWTRNSVSIGDGVYKSTDGGDTWTNVGLPESERIAALAVHPKDGRTVYACAAGKLWSDSTERGLYKTTDAGATWRLVLKGPNASTGCASVSMDPSNPDRLFASLWDFRRQGWTFRSGGESPAAESGSGLFVSSDGGDTWAPLDAATTKGLPAKPWGRVAVAVAPSEPKRVYVVVECARSALFVSDDGGRTFEERDRSQGMVWRPFYFANLVVDPKEKDRVFKMGLGLIVSNDGGRSFSPASGGSHGDWHDVWIDPTNTQHLVGGDDGGLWISHDGGNRWWKVDSLPVAQFYHVSVDDKDPYQVYGGLQDNSSWAGDSAYPGGITNSRWENLFGGDGFWAFADPADPEYAYAESQGGYLGRVNRKTLEARDIQPKAAKGEKLRFNWNAPVHLSPNEKGTIYIGAQFLFRSRDHGQNWERISPDLTTNDPKRQQQEQSGGVTVDNSAAEMHTTIYSISESPKNGRRIWVGTDDGRVQVTRDGGATWTDTWAKVTGVPPGSWISWVEASRFDERRAYVAVDRHTFGDMAPYIYRTDDDGQTWRRIAGPEQGLRGYVHVIREDLERPDLLFAGTEFGLWVSIDGGAHWAQFTPGTFPAVAVRDLVVHPRDHDLVLATHGRGIWIVDDITPLRRLSDTVLATEAAFIESRTTQQRIRGNGGWANGDAVFVGENPPDGAVITYYQRTRHLFGRISLQILDSSGVVVDTIPASARRGINRVTWSMRVKAPEVPPAASVAGAGFNGPRVVPGDYTLRLTKGEKTYETKLSIGLDRRATFSAADRKAQFDAAMRVHALFGRMSADMRRVDAVRGAAERELAALPAKDPARGPLEALERRSDEVRKRVVATTEGGAITGEERLREHADMLYGALLSYEGRPATYQLARIDALTTELQEIEADFDAVLKTDLPAANAALKKKGRPVIAVPVAGPPVAALSSGSVPVEPAAAILRAMRSR